MANASKEVEGTNSIDAVPKKSVEEGCFYFGRTCFEIPEIIFNRIDEITVGEFFEFLASHYVFFHNLFYDFDITTVSARTYNGIVEKSLEDKLKDLLFEDELTPVRYLFITGYKQEMKPI